jgi:hypothetical protein
MEAFIVMEMATSYRDYYEDKTHGVFFKEEDAKAYIEDIRNELTSEEINEHCTIDEGERISRFGFTQVGVHQRYVEDTFKIIPSTIS